MTVVVRDIMTESPYTLSEEADLTQLFDLFDAKRVRHVPITDEDGRVLGIVSHRDMIRGALAGVPDMPLHAQRERLRDVRVEEIMVRDPVTIDPDETIQSAGEIIYENKLGCLPVVEGDLLVGILTESDFVRYTLEDLEHE